MFNSATIDIPQTGHIGPSGHCGLSDVMALSFGRLAARLLDPNQWVKVTLKSGDAILIGRDDLTGQLTERTVL